MSRACPRKQRDIIPAGPTAERKLGGKALRNPKKNESIEMKAESNRV